MKHKEKQTVKTTTIATRLAQSFVACMLLPTILIATFLCIQTVSTYQTNAKQQMITSINLISETLGNYFDDINALTSLPYYHSYFSSSKKVSSLDSDMTVDLIAFKEEMRTLINTSTYEYTDVNNYLIWSDGVLMYYYLRDELVYLNMDLTEESWYPEIVAGNTLMMFLPATENAEKEQEELISTSSYLVIKRIRNLHQLEQYNIVLLDMETRDLDNMCQSLDLMYHSFIVLVNEEGELIYSNRALSANELTNILSDTDFHYWDETWTKESTTLADYPLTVHLVYSVSDVNGELWPIILIALAICLAGIGLSLFLFRRFNQWISLSAEGLTGAFRELETGNLQASCPEVPVAEFDYIGKCVNQVIHQLDEKIKNEYLLTIQQTNTQLYALRSQIQPHFLINTLYCFISLNQTGETKKLGTAFYQLASLLRYVLSKEYYTTLGKELDFLEAYLSLQQLRFGTRLSFRMECPRDLESVKIPRLLLQPLVENAVIHGIEPSETGCTCWISAEIRDGALYIRIEDDGVGLDAQAIMEKLQDAEHDAFDADMRADSGGNQKGVGLSYVMKRLHMWNPAASLTVTCNGKTRCEFRIPRGAWKSDPDLSNA